MPDVIAPSLYLLDMGAEKYGDCILGRFGEVTVLIDGGHRRDDQMHGDTPSIPEQLARILGHPPPFDLSLLVVTHCHADHIGCLPALVARGDLRPAWALVADENLGFGRAAGDAGGMGDELDAPDVAPVLRRLVAALREESQAGTGDPAAVEQFLADAAQLEPAYRQMLATLEQRGTRVVRYGRDDAAPLEEAFAMAGLKILGPTQDHLLLCAEAIARLTQDALAALADVGADALAGETVDEVALYRSLVLRSFSDAADKPGRGAALNDQSIVLRFAPGGLKVLLTGDMQLAKAEIAGLDPYMSALRSTIKADGPFDFVKIAHHGSYNALDAGALADLAGTRCFAISGGSQDPVHPDPGVLRLLQRNLPQIQWARTDRNGLITVSLGPGGVRLEPERGELNDSRANTPDFVAQPHPAAAPRAEPLPPVSWAPAVSSDSGMVEVITRIPHVATRVVVTIDVQPLAAPAVPGPPAPSRTAVPRGVDRSLPELRIAGGRNLPPLLFATSAEGLARNIGQAEASHLLASLRGAGQTVMDTLPAGSSDAAVAASVVRDQLEDRHRGVVLLGGYDIVPAQKLDTLDPDLRAKLPASHGDEDDFIVWSDDVYGDVQGDAFPEVPVSRIPDGLSAELMFAAIQAGRGSSRPSRFGLRNSQRPFAQEIYQVLAGEEDLLICERTTPPDINSSVLDADAIYLMLHGSDSDGTRFWGEDEAGTLEAINLGNIPARSSAVVFTGCCWGALCVDRPAARTEPGLAPASRTPASSIALSFLRAGALAFIGCTGSHYSPVAKPFTYFGAPMHQAFWERYQQGLAPAQALLQAKQDYLEDMPHGRSSVQGKAIERKILWQYTCLGLGW